MNHDTIEANEEQLGSEDCFIEPSLTMLPSVGQPKPAATFPPNDIGNAAALAHYHGEELRYCYPWRSWVVWDGTRWKRDDNGEIRRRAESTLQTLLKAAVKIEDPDKQKAAAAWALASMTNRRIKDMIESAQSRLAIPVDAFDKDHFLLNCQNGTIDLSTGELGPHRKEDFITKIVPTHYDPGALCPFWMSFLRMAMREKDGMVNFLQRAVGYSLTGSCIEQVMFILHGTGSNGKSTFLEIIGFLMGEYFMTMASETITVQQPGKMANDIARLRGARFVAASETEDGHRLAEAKVKQMTGGDTLVGEFKFQESFEFKPQFKIWLATNHLPQIRGGGDAIWRRLPLISFEAWFWRAERGESGDPQYQADISLPERLRAEMPGILRWAVEGCLAWQEQGLGQPQEIVQATLDYRAEMDSIAGFIDECIVEHPTYDAKKSEVYNRYKKWAEDSGEYVVSQKALGLKLKERGWQERRAGGARFWSNRSVIWPQSG